MYRVVVFATAVLCLLAFANSPSFALQSAQEVTHYSAAEDFLCSRNTGDDLTGISQDTVTTAVPGWQLVVVRQEVRLDLQNCYTLNDIRGPPSPASLI